MKNDQSLLGYDSNGQPVYDQGSSMSRQNSRTNGYNTGYDQYGNPTQSKGGKGEYDQYGGQNGRNGYNNYD